MPLSPANGSTLGAGTTSTILTASNVAVPAGVLVFLKFEIARDAAFSDVTQSSTLRQAAGVYTQFTASNLEQARTYHWRVRALAGESTGATSETFTFSLDRQVGIAAPVIRHPEEGTTVDIKPRFTVPRGLSDPALGPVTLRLEFTQDSHFVSKVVAISQPQSSNAFTFLDAPFSLAPGVYVSRVSATAGGVTSPWSAVRQFIVGPSFAEKPVPLLPQNGSTVPSQRVTLVVADAPHSGSSMSAAYRFEVSRTTDFGVTVFRGIVSLGPEKTASTTSDSLAPGTYYWRAQTYISDVSSPWTAPWSFVVGAEVIETPTVPRPTYDAIVHTRPELSVKNAVRSGGGGTLMYRFEIAIMSAGVFYAPGGLVDSAVVSESPSGRTSWVVPADLIPGQQYRWRVLVSDAVTGVEAPAWAESSFRTVPASAHLWYLDLDLPKSCDTKLNLSSYYATSDGPFDPTNFRVTTTGSMVLQLARGVGTIGGHAYAIGSGLTALIDSEGANNPSAKAIGGQTLYGEILGSFDGRVVFFNSFDGAGECTASSIRWKLRPR